jgi:SAM-dependent methyltransferase
VVDDGLACAECGLRFTSDRVGVWISREGGSVRDRSAALRLMRSRPITAIYERLWRPALVRLVSDLSYAFEDRLLDENLAGVQRPDVLELCCGTARVARRFVALGGRGVGIDISATMLLQARRRCADSRLVLLRGDAQRQFARRGAFDVAVCFAALHLLDDPRLLLEKAAAALRPRGLLACWALVRRGRLMGSNTLAGLMQVLGLAPLQPRELRGLVESLGFSVIDDLSTGAVDLVLARGGRQK